MARPKQKINLTKNGKIVLEKRYLKKTKTGKPLEKPENLFNRVAEFISKADKNYGATDEDVKKTKREFYNSMARLDFLPNSPCLAGAGREGANLFACFLLPVPDSIDGIFETAKISASIQKGGGGVGYNFSKLRPTGSKVKTTTGISSGPITFMKVYDTITEVIKQGAFRRGANLGLLSCDHPSIMEFIDCKKNKKNGEMSNFNISVAATDQFMKAVQNKKKYKLYNPHTDKKYLGPMANEVFDKIAENAWSNGDPGFLFIDTVNAHNPLPKAGPLDGCNPCGEQVLHYWEACVLASVNLYNHIKGKDIDYDKLRKTVRRAVHFLDNTIDVNNFPHEKIKDVTMKNRKIGLGVMGFADVLFELGIPYNSNEAISLANNTMKFITKTASEMSVELGKKRGAFENIDKSIWNDSRRNATVTTIAPTGTIGLIAGTSGGIEPVFALAYKRMMAEGDELTEINPVLERKLKEKKLYSDKIIKEIIDKGSVQDIKEIPDDIKKVFVTAMDIDWKWHIKMQAAWQKQTHNAVSKTINMPHTATKEDVKQAYMMAYKMGCKGITIYRDRSRDEQVLKIDKAKKVPSERPQILDGSTIKTKMGECGNLFMMMNEQDGKLVENFCTMGKGGTCLGAWTETTGRLISLALRSGVKPEEIIKQLRRIRCSEVIFTKEGKLFSCPDAIGAAMEAHLKKTGNIELPKDLGAPKEKCKQCGGRLVFSEGCMNCPSCGASKCG